ncbi:MAG: hypothetical protein WBX15_17810 [Thermoanaerobaculia bacterium]
MRIRARGPIVAAAPVTPVDVRVHWIASGEAAPFDGILLDAATYAALREKIARLQGELAKCRGAGGAAQ